MNVFNLTANDNVSEMLKEGVDYIIVKDGNGAETKIVNLANEKYCPRKGFIEIEAMRKSNKHENVKMIRKIRDKKLTYSMVFQQELTQKLKSYSLKQFG